MPLIKCINCGQEYSSYRHNCPNCGTATDGHSLSLEINAKEDLSVVRKSYNDKVLERYQISLKEDDRTIQLGTKTISFDDIIDYNFIDLSYIASSGDGKITTQTKSNTGSMLGRSIAGGIILGPAGAIIGGATSSKSSESTVTLPSTTTIRQYELQIVINDFNDPVIRFRFDNPSEPNIIISFLKIIFFRRNK